MNIIHLVRHGQTLQNLDHQSPPTTSDIGREQALALATRLAGTHFDRILSSTMHRALDTAACIARFHSHLSIETSSLFDEIHGTVVGKPDERQPPVGTAQQEIERMAAAWAYVGSFNGTTLIICHNNVIRYLIGVVLNLPAASCHKMQIENTSINTIGVLKGRWRVLTLNDINHLNQELLADNSPRRHALI